MASETQIGQLVIDLKIKTEAIEKGLETAKNKLREIESSNEQVENSNKSLDASYLAMSATAIIALGKIVSSIKDCVNEYNSYTQAMNSLRSVSGYTGESMSKFSDIMNEFDSYMTQADLATTIKNFSLMGYTADDTRKMIEALIKSAINGGNSCYTVSEKVRVSSEGFRQGLSTLSDAGGVVENLSIMQEKYAESIGKTASQLTQEEINQAYLNRTMYAAEPFTQSMIDYTETLAFKQGEYSKAIRETQVAFIEALEPTLAKMTEGGTGVLNILNSLINANPTIVSGLTTFAITLASVTVAMIALKKAKDAYTASAFAATASTKGFTAALMANPIFLIATAIATTIAGINMLCSAIRENEEAQAKLNETTERYKQIKDETYGYTDKDISTVENDKTAIEKQVNILEKKIELQKKLNELKVEGINGTYSYKTEDLNEVKKYVEEIKKTEKEFKDAQEATDNYGNSIEELNEKLNENKEYLTKADAVKKISKGLDIETVKKQQQEAAQLKINAQTMQEYLNVVKKGDTSTTQYQEAVKQLAKAYPDAANAEGIMVSQAQNLINAEALKADTAWKGSQDTINSYIAVLNAALNSESVQKQVAQNVGISVEDLNVKLQSTLALYNAMANAAPAAVAGVKPVSVSAPKLRSSGGSKASKSYENKALDNYKKQIEHKKSLDQISLQQEISMYQTALRKYAKTQDEKWELTEKIYSLQKELREKNLDDYTADIEHRKALDKLSLQQEINMYQYAYNALAKTTEQKREIEEKLHDLRKELAQKNKELLEQKTTDYKRYIEDQKNLRGAEYDAKEQERDLNKIISLHKNYLNQIMKDERLSLDERKELYQEELETIRDYEQQKRDLRVQSVDDTVSQLTSAITKQLEEMEEADKKAIEENIRLVEKWKETRINAINEEYEARIEAIQKELDLLDKSEEDKTRAEEDAEHQRKKNRLEQLIAYEHDATTKANYQKELDKLVADYQKTLDKRALQDKKDTLKEQQDLLKEEQDKKVQAIEDEADKQKEEYDKQLDKLEEYYNKQKEIAQDTAEKMLLNVERNQNQIISLLKSYGNAYEITGQSLGEKLAQGINNGIANKIQNIIQKLQDTIDAGIENKIKQWTTGMYKYEAGVNKPQAKTITITQQNYIEQNPEMPSETYRKLNNVSERLAAEIAGM